MSIIFSQWVLMYVRAWRPPCRLCIFSYIHQRQLTDCEGTWWWSWSHWVQTNPLSIMIKLAVNFNPSEVSNLHLQYWCKQGGPHTSSTWVYLPDKLVHISVTMCFDIYPLMFSPGVVSARFIILARQKAPAQLTLSSLIYITDNWRFITLCNSPAVADKATYYSFCCTFFYWSFTVYYHVVGGHRCSKDSGKNI